MDKKYFVLKIQQIWTNEDTDHRTKIIETEKLINKYDSELKILNIPVVIKRF